MCPLLTIETRTMTQHARCARESLWISHATWIYLICEDTYIFVQTAMRKCCLGRLVHKSRTKIYVHNICTLFEVTYSGKHKHVHIKRKWISSHINIYTYIFVQTAIGKRGLGSLVRKAQRLDRSILQAPKTSASVRKRMHMKPKHTKQEHIKEMHK